MSRLFIDGSKLQYHLDRIEDWIKKKEIFPIHVEVSPASACNQRCILCCVDFKHHESSLLSREVLLKLADDFATCGVKSYLLAGEGEPLLNKHVVEFAAKCSENGVDGALTSNGVLLNEDVSNKLLPSILWARFSMQSSYPEKYAHIHDTKEKDYFKVIENIKKAVLIKKEKNPSVTLGIQQILINENWDEVYPLAKLSKELGVDYFTVKRFSKHPLNVYDVPEDLYKQSTEQFRKSEELSDKNFKVLIRWQQFEKQIVRNYKKCIGLPFITQVLADGGIYPCCQYFGDPSKCFGNLNEKSFSEIWLSDRKKAIMKEIENSVDVSNCMTYCRHHSTNMFLWQFMELPEHVNFI